MCKGSPRVLGDEDEDDVDDIEHEFKHEEMLQGNKTHRDSDVGLAKVSLRRIENYTCI